MANQRPIISSAFRRTLKSIPQNADVQRTISHAVDCAIKENVSDITVDCDNLRIELDPPWEQSGYRYNAIVFNKCRIKIGAPFAPGEQSSSTEEIQNFMRIQHLRIMNIAPPAQDQDQDQDQDQ